jgi:hypothetical protein
MKAKNKHLLFAFFLLGTLWSCEKEIPYKGDDSESLLVVNQIIEKDSTFSVGIERSRFFLESFMSNTMLDDAVVTIKNTTTGVSETQSAGNNGLYDFAMIAQEGHSYEITASHASYPTATGKTMIPSSVPLISVDTVSYDNENLSKVMNAKLTWNDPAGKNYYMIVVKSNNLFPQAMYLNSSDVSITNGGTNLVGAESYDYFFALNDESFDGLQKEFTLEFGHYLYGTGTGYQYQLYNCTEDAYRYLVSVNTNTNSDGGPFSEPVKVHKNIDGGYGIFGGINKSQIIK